MSEILEVDDVLEADAALPLQRAEELEVVLLGEAGDLRHAPLRPAARVHEVGRDGNGHLGVQTAPVEARYGDLLAGGADDDVVLLGALEHGAVLAPDLRHHAPPPPHPGGRGHEPLEGLPDVDGGADEERHLEEGDLQHPDADVVDRPVPQHRVQLLGPETLEVLHDAGPQLDHVVPVEAGPSLH